MNSRLDWVDAAAPSLEQFASMAERAYAGLPETFRAMAGEVVMQVADLPDDEMLEELGLEHPYELTGLYQGVDLTRRSVFDPTPRQSMVFLFRRPILDEWAELGDVTLGELITHVLIHEIGHHFGLSDDAMEAIEAQA
jgi:predicted Zn-dependent protease with MMP-like domain